MAHTETETIECPLGLHIHEETYVGKLIHQGYEYLAYLLYMAQGIGKKVLISKDMFEDIRHSWEDDTDTIILLQVGGGDFRRDGVLVCNSLKVVGKRQE